MKSLATSRSSVNARAAQIEEFGQDKPIGAHGLSSPDAVVDAIVSGIRLGRFVPGQKLVEADLTQSIGVSRGPVREALKRLAAEGIVSLTRHRGAYIRVLTRAEVDQTLVVLEVLTGLMARLAAETVRRGGHAAKMREAFRWLAIYKAGSDSGIEQIEKRRHFYDTLAEIGGNQELDRILPAMQIHLLRMQTLPYQTAEDKRLQLLSYSEVTEAVLAGNPKLAERAMRKHLRRTRAHLKHVSDAAFAPPKAGS